jgi:hypothetical protein
MTHDNDHPEPTQAAPGGRRVCELCGHVAAAYEFVTYFYAADACLLRCLDLRACAARLMRQQTRDRGGCPGCGG